MADKKKSDKESEIDPKTDASANDGSKTIADVSSVEGAEIDADTAAEKRTSDVSDKLTDDAAEIADTEVVTSEPIDDDLKGDRSGDDAKGKDATNDTDPKPENLPPATVEVVERVIEKRGGVLPALIGGIIAAILGFLAASTDVLSPYLPASLQRPDVSAEIAAVQASVDETNSALGDLRNEVEGAEEVDLSGIEGRIDEIAATLEPFPDQLTALGDRIEALETRLTEVEKQPLAQGVSPEAIAAYERELEALQNSVNTQRSEIEAMLNEAREMDASAADTARAASARAALTLLRSAIDSGAPYPAPVEQLEQLGVSPPDALAETAAEGVVALSTLRDRFPDAARTALAAARSENSGQDGVAGFLRRQLGARSVAPRDGDDPDAVLSRAEAALETGDLSTALSEIETLPESAQAALSDWTNAARARLDATAAAEDLSQRLNEN